MELEFTLSPCAGICDEYLEFEEKRDDPAFMDFFPCDDCEFNPDNQEG